MATDEVPRTVRIRYDYKDGREGWFALHALADIAENMSGVYYLGITLEETDIVIADDRHAFGKFMPGKFYLLHVKDKECFEQLFPTDDTGLRPGETLIDLIKKIQNS